MAPNITGCDSFCAPPPHFSSTPPPHHGRISSSIHSAFVGRLEPPDDSKCHPRAPSSFFTLCFFSPSLHVFSFSLYSRLEARFTPHSRPTSPQRIFHDFTPLKTPKMVSTRRPKWGWPERGGARQQELDIFPLCSFILPAALLDSGGVTALSRHVGGHTKEKKRWCVCVCVCVCVWELGQGYGTVRTPILGGAAS